MRKFLLTALPIFRLTVIPRRVLPCRLGRRNTRKKRVENLLPFRVTARKSERSRIRSCFGKPKPERPASSLHEWSLIRSAGSFSGMRGTEAFSRNQLLAAFPPATAENLSPTPCLHPGAESVGPFPPRVAGLIGAFHSKPPQESRTRQNPVARIRIITSCLDSGLKTGPARSRERQADCTLPDCGSESTMASPVKDHKSAGLSTSGPSRKPLSVLWNSRVFSYCPSAGRQDQTVLTGGPQGQETPSPARSRESHPQSLGRPFPCRPRSSTAFPLSGW